MLHILYSINECATDVLTLKKKKVQNPTLEFQEELNLILNASLRSPVSVWTCRAVATVPTEPQYPTVLQNHDNWKLKTPHKITVEQENQQQK